MFDFIKTTAKLALDIASGITIVILFLLAAAFVTALIAGYLGLWVIGLAMALPYTLTKKVLTLLFKR